MWAIVIVCMAIVVLTFYQVHTQGFFSTVIMAGDSMLAAFVALNYYESLTELLAGVGLAGFGLACITLLGLFSATLLILRLGTDVLISGNMNFPILVDRIGAAVFGLISSMIVVGMILIGFQHLAVPAEFLGYNRYPNLAKLEDERGLFPEPDRFVLSLLDHASNFSFSGKTAFFQHHPDLLRELYLNRIVPREHEGSRNEANSDALKLVDARLINRPVRDLKSREVVDVPAGETLLALRLEIKPGLSKEKPGASDVDGKIRFALGDFRLVGYEQDVPRSTGYSRYPIGFLKPAGAVVEKATPGTGKILTSSSKQVDLLFQWPGNVKKIPPLYVEFKRTARAKMPASEKLEEAALSMKTLYDAGNTALQAKLTGTSRSREPFLLQNLVVVPFGAQPLDDMLIPVNSFVQRAEKMGEVKSEGGYRHIHIAPTEHTQRDQIGTRLQLAVPDGFCLVYLKIKGNSSRQGSAYTPAVLVDIFGHEYHSVGFSLFGTLGGKNVCEFAYTSYGDQGSELDSKSIRSKRFPREIKTLKQGGKLRKMTQFYLVAKKKFPVGLLGAQVKRGRSDEGTFWVPSDNIDVVLVPAL